MRTNIKQYILLVIAIYLSCTLLNGQDINKIRKEIDELNRISKEGILEDDLEKQASILADDLIFMPNNHPIINGKKAWYELAKETQKLNQKYLAIDFKTLEIDVCGEIVTEIGNYSVSVKIPEISYPITDVGKYINIWERQKNGELKITFTMINTDLSIQAWLDMLKQ